MNRLIKTISIFCFILYFCVIAFSNAAQVNEDIDIEFKDQSISAKLKNASLIRVLEKIKQETGIWINLNESMHGKEVSISFDHLSLEAGMKRILHNFNHILVYGQDKSLVGIYILNKKSPGGAQILKADINKEKGMPQTTKDDTDNRNPFQKFNPFQSFKKMPFPDESDGEIDKKTAISVFPPSKDQGVRSSEETLVEDAQPFTNPFADITSQGFEDLRNEKVAQEIENPFERTIPPSLENSDLPNLAPIPKNPLAEKNYSPIKNPFTPNP